MFPMFPLICNKYRGQMHSTPMPGGWQLLLRQQLPAENDTFTQVEAILVNSTLSEAILTRISNQCC